MSRFHLVQADLHWEDPGANRHLLAELMGDLRGGVIVLPEMFSTGFSMASSRLAESMDGPTVNWMQDMAGKHAATLSGSLIIEDDGRYYNRFLWVEPSGNIAYYDKRHLFRMADEHDHYSPGARRVLVSHDKTVLLPQVCYDLRFPAWSRNRNDYHALLYVANWPAARRDQWLALLRARAIENLSYVVAVNRVGRDGNGIGYAGDSCVLDFRGELLLDMASEELVTSIDLDIPALQAYREAFPAWRDADELEIRP